MPQGWPYLVMEYIEGEPLTEYCNKREVPVSVRLEHFRAVCAAVQHAPPNLIIHRDLKPGNILVTKNATVKLLDFGIAKLLDPELTIDGGVTDFAKTATALRVMTPDYASPEQARGEAVTTATDVYSLQARRAERRFQQVRKLANTFLFEFDGKIQNITGTTEARELLVKTALEYLDSLAREAGNEAEFQYELASAYARVGDVQGYTRMNNLGHSTEALASYHKAKALG